METTNINKEILAFNKNAIKMNFEALSAISGQAASTVDTLLGANTSIPEEGKKAVSTYFKENQKGLATLRKHVENGLELDWTAKDAPAKNLEAMESFCKDVFSQASEIRKETNTLIEKATKQLPKEAKTLVDFWNNSFTSGFEFFQNCVNKNFELAKKVLADATPAETKASK